MSNLAMMMGLGSAGGAVNVADVFSTYLYTGDSTSPRTITNGIDLSGEGGLVWFKSRTTTTFHGLFDTERGATKRLRSDSTNAEDTLASDLTAFNSDGFTLGNGGTTNTSPREYASWTFRKAPKFFDVVEFSTGGSAVEQTINHSLGSTPGMIIIKCTTNIGSWFVWHRSIGTTQYLRLEATDAVATYDGVINNVTSTSFTTDVGTAIPINSTAIAYLFAHNEDLIQCGSYTGTGANGNSIELGFKPQWIMIKRTNSTGNWIIVDEERGMTDSAYAWLYPNSSSGEDAGASSSGLPLAEATGFTVNGSSIWMNASGSTYIYMAIKAE